jgi:geranylgeranyl diphosphate synthase type II
MSSAPAIEPRKHSLVVPALLHEYGSIVRSVLPEYLPKKEPRRYLYDLIADYPQRGGKMMRPGLCIATARAFGAPIEHALGPAIAIELLHNALLIHDDIEDQSEERRGRPTLHMLHGIPLALNAGDSMTLISLRPLIEHAEYLGPEISLRLMQEVEMMARETAEGQAMELGWRYDNALDVTVADYLEMVLRKTCWLATIFPIRVGAMIGSRGQADLNALFRFGFFLGAAFQIQDDLLNLVHNDERYGKERNGDLWEGKRTLPIIHLLQQVNPEEKERLRSILMLSREHRSIEQVQWMRELMDARGSIDYARQIAHGLAGAAMHESSRLFSRLPDSPDKQFLLEVTPWVIERDEL